MVLGVLAFFIKKRKTSNTRKKLQVLIPLKHYHYTEVKRFTESFACVVGRGGFGTVYKGNLPDGRKIAVKVLKDSKSNGEDFINEVSSMSQTSHVNIVSLIGFCYEGSKIMIVYEFLKNGSLDQFISMNAASTAEWRMRFYKIALGVARGIDYGMLVLGMIGATKKNRVEKDASNASSIYDPDGIYKDIKNGKQCKLLGDELTKEQEEITKKMILVALWCIQSSPTNRPSMNRVVEMMEGTLDALEVPPKPVLHLRA
ncbi:PREDICTED: LEAF RUST 10 DISEASE-RESISTANCE LOCUS RECEPTOR-LIKE PROTEIN KINASE-like 2.1 [Camelina sativa]|uniref:LEAF RUST 10 DISEASE-RESISTANCE LOCUS RECEPTOR-LIKE PROTEIN KINASE-like 2.1 n=1 Tax=Camelina sativa TaxID=90675 RepID=A0ABM0T0P8_CAMSA|nr:PREDICTED: LEAF RUST 10 DISEASE-RESISTANCE LOCUS RECEPTOR-LIKE PROTEIN KINASE-like 2.1 [Camelina sativa]